MALQRRPHAQGAGGLLPAKRSIVKGVPEARRAGPRVVSPGNAAADKRPHGHIVWKADQGPTGPAGTDPHGDEAVAPEEARRSIEKLEWHYTPQHGSWLERAESALRVLQRQGFDRRIPDPQT